MKLIFSLLFLCIYFPTNIFAPGVIRPGTINAAIKVGAQIAGKQKGLSSKHFLTIQQQQSRMLHAPSRNTRLLLKPQNENIPPMSRVLSFQQWKPLTRSNSAALSSPKLSLAKEQHFSHFPSNLAVQLRAVPEEKKKDYSMLKNAIEVVKGVFGVVTNDLKALNDIFGKEMEGKKYLTNPAAIPKARRSLLLTRMGTEIAANGMSERAGLLGAIEDEEMEGEEENMEEIKERAGKLFETEMDELKQIFNLEEEDVRFILPEFLPKNLALKAGIKNITEMGWEEMEKVKKYIQNNRHKMMEKLEENLARSEGEWERALKIQKTMELIEFVQTKLEIMEMAKKVAETENAAEMAKNKEMVEQWNKLNWTLYNMAFSANGIFNGEIHPEMIWNENNSKITAILEKFVGRGAKKLATGTNVAFEEFSGKECVDEDLMCNREKEMVQKISKLLLIPNSG